MSGKQLAGLLCDTDRVRTFSAVALGASTVADIERVSGLRGPAIEVALRRLVSAELVEKEADRLRINVNYLNAAARQPDPTSSASARTAESAPDFVDRFVRDRRIRALPAQRGRRQVILELVCNSTFEVDTTYSEAEVNTALEEWCAGGGSDYVTIRRYLIDAGLMTRHDGQYRRAPGVARPPG